MLDNFRPKPARRGCGHIVFVDQRKELQHALAPHEQFFSDDMPLLESEVPARQQRVEFTLMPDLRHPGKFRAINITGADGKPLRIKEYDAMRV